MTIHERYIRQIVKDRNLYTHFASNYLALFSLANTFASDTKIDRSEMFEVIKRQAMHRFMRRLNHKDYRSILNKIGDYEKFLAEQAEEIGTSPDDVWRIALSVHKPISAVPDAWEISLKDDWFVFKWIEVVSENPIDTKKATALYWYADFLEDPSHRIDLQVEIHDLGRKTIETISPYRFEIHGKKAFSKFAKISRDEFLTL